MRSHSFRSSTVEIDQHNVPFELNWEYSMAFLMMGLRRTKYQRPPTGLAILSTVQRQCSIHFHSWFDYCGACEWVMFQPNRCSLLVVVATVVVNVVYTTRFSDKSYDVYKNLVKKRNKTQTIIKHKTFKPVDLFFNLIFDFRQHSMINNKLWHFSHSNVQMYPMYVCKK